MDDLVAGMHTGIGATGHNQVDRVIGNASDRIGQNSLNRWHASLLDLPAKVTGTPILYAHGNPMGVFSL
jgi:hypothetical protein